MPNPDGRTNGSYGKHRRRIELALAREDYEPYEENIKVAKGLKILLAKKWKAADDPGVLDASRELAKVNDSLCTYAYPRIKAIEVTADREVMEHMSIEAQIAMAREFAQLIGYDFVKAGHPDPDTLPAAERAEAETLAKELGYLPLALAQARAYMAGAGKSLAGYRRLFEASRPAVLERGRASQDYPTSVAKTWQISIEAAEGVCAAARPLLELLAFFAPDALPMEVLASAPVTLPEGLGDELERDEARP